MRDNYLNNSMIASGTKNKVKEIIRDKSINLCLPEFVKKISLDKCKIYLNKYEVGIIQLAYVTSTASGYGSLFGVYAQCVVNGGKIVSC